MQKIVVAQDGSGDCVSIQEAIMKARKIAAGKVEIYLRAGEYRETVLIDRPLIELTGEDREKTKIVYGNYAEMRLPSGERGGTFRSATLRIDANDVVLKNLTVANDAGCGTQKGPAIALYADGDRLLVEHCNILGKQDTLFTAPLPPTPMVKDGFAGPKEHQPRIHGRHLYRKCYISGDIDFIFGSATAYFEECIIFSENNVRDEQKGYITAASTPEGIEFGYIFDHCRFESNCPAESVYLGRPWRNYAKTVLISCYLDQHIKKEGWHDWDKLAARQSIFYAEYESYGEGQSNIRAPYAKMLSKAELSRYNKTAVLGEWAGAC